MNTEHFYLTNACCENAGLVGARWMQRLGLDFGDFEGFFYPLTNEEARFIGEDQVAVGDSAEAWLSYAVLYQDRKWLAPVVEIGFRGEGTPSREFAEYTSQLIYGQISKRVGRVGGHVFLIESDDRFWVEIMLPFELAMPHRDLDGWKAFLERELFADISVATHSMALAA